MLLNHKDALDFIFVMFSEYLKDLTVGRIEEIHAYLQRIRRRGIYDTVEQVATEQTIRRWINEFQIRKHWKILKVRLINGKSNIFDKARLALIPLSHIQAFTDGNKRTAVCSSNGILIANGYCPISFRTVDSVDYKKPC